VNRFAAALFALSLAGGCALQAQTNPLIAENKATYNNVKNNLIKAAEKMPEDAYVFKPTPEVQSWMQRIAHIANQIGTCSSLTGERKTSDASKQTAKPDLVAALKASFDACDAAWDSMNDKTAMEMIAGRGGAQRTKLSVLIGNTTHDVEMYGYLSVYMRLKGVVPPSSDHN
jgi:Holliday junction resolvase RusA-like endonuclease